MLSIEKNYKFYVLCSAKQVPAKIVINVWIVWRLTFAKTPSLEYAILNILKCKARLTVSDLSGDVLP